MIDSHCHFTHFDDAEIPDLIHEAHSLGVTTMLNIGVELEHMNRLMHQHQTFGLPYSIGVHPHGTLELTDSDITSMRHALQNAIAVGEIGLDSYRQKETVVQRHNLALQLDLALSLQLPVIIHSRDEETALLEHLTVYAQKCSSPPGVIHCFTGSLTFGRACLDLGFYLSFSGILTFKNAELVRDAARMCPLDRLLVETDAPYLAPVPFRGKKCRPAMVTHTAKTLAEIRNCTLSTINEVTCTNTKTLFHKL